MKTQTLQFRHPGYATNKMKDMTKLKRALDTALAAAQALERRLTTLTAQPPSPVQRQTRTLALEPFGDGTQLRIKGKWLTKAGFPPGASVLLTVCSAGVVEIRLNAPPQLRGEHFDIASPRLEQTRNDGPA